MQQLLQSGAVVESDAMEEDPQGGESTEHRDKKVKKQVEASEHAGEAASFETRAEMLAREDVDPYAEDDERPWSQVGGDAGVERLRARLGLGRDAELGQFLVWKLTARQKPGGREKKAQTQSATKQQSERAEDPNRPASCWDSVHWDARIRGTPKESEVEFPPLGASAPGAPIAPGRAAAPKTQSPARASGSGTQDTARGTPAAPQTAGSVTGQRSGTQAADVIDLDAVMGDAGGVPATPPAEEIGAEGGGGDGRHT